FCVPPFCKSSVLNAQGVQSFTAAGPSLLVGIPVQAELTHHLADGVGVAGDSQVVHINIDQYGVRQGTSNLDILDNPSKDAGGFLSLCPCTAEAVTKAQLVNPLLSHAVNVPSVLHDFGFVVLLHGVVLLYYVCCPLSL